MGTIFLQNRHFSPFDILVKNFFQTEEQFQTPKNKIINHPVDIYEDKDGLYFDIACTGLTKKQIDINVEGDILRVSYTKQDKDEDKDLHHYHSGIAKRSFDLGWKIARRFDLSKIEASMKDGLLKLFIPLTPESKPKTVSIK
jgi:HSP20 family molecular chaperone IbpA|tara:strand:- start:68 stop:493 length:426 start_codon:yes stop_codon:yes gene_type:complete